VYLRELIGAELVITIHLFLACSFFIGHDLIPLPHAWALFCLRLLTAAAPTIILWTQLPSVSMDPDTHQHQNGWANKPGGNVYAPAVSSALTPASAPRVLAAASSAAHLSR
jgi:hypothetical protein